MTPEEVDSFLTGSAPAPVAPAVMQGAQPPQSLDDVDAFLTGLPTGESTPADQQQRSKLAGEMTHMPFKTPDYSIRPKVITEGFKKGWAGFASLPGYAIDAGDWVLKDSLSFLYTPEELEAPPVGGTASIRKGWELLTGYKPVEPVNPAERFAGKAAEFIGGGGPMTMRTIANEAIRMAGSGMTKQQVAREIAGIVGMDVASGAAGGVNAEYLGGILAESLGEDWRIVGELVGGVSGGAAPHYAKNVAGGTQNVSAMVTDPTIKQTIFENQAKQKIMDAMGESPHAKENLERAIALQKQIPGYNPNLAASTDSAGLSIYQRGLDEKSVENYNRSARMIENSKASIDSYYRNVMPKLDDDLTPYLKSRYEQAVATSKQRLTLIDKKSANLEKSFERRPSRAIGARLRELKAEKYESVRAEKNKKYADLYKASDDAGVVAEVSDIKKATQDILTEDANAFQNMPRVYSKIKQLLPEREVAVSPIITQVGAPMKTETILGTASFSKIHSLMKEINTEYGKALRSGDSYKEYYLSKIKPMVDRKIEGFDDPVYGSFAQHKQAVDQWWLNEYYNVFKQGLGAKISRKTKLGDRTPDEDVVNTYVLGKGSEGITQFNKVYENVPEAQMLLRDGIIDSLASKIHTNGFTQKTIDRFLFNNREVMDELPDLKNTLSDTGVAINVLAKRKARVEDFQKKIITNKNNIYANAAGFGNIEEAVSSAVKSKPVLNLLLRKAKTDTQKHNLATGFADHILAQKKPWEYLANNENTLKPVLNKLGPNHYKNLKDISDAYKIMDRYQLPTSLSREAGTLDPVKKLTGTSFISAFAQFRFAYFYGKTSEVYPYVDIGSKYLFKQGQRQIEKMIEKSMYDPDLARTLANLTKRKEVPFKLWTSLSEKMLGVRLKAVAVTSESLNEQFQREIQ